MADEHSTTPLTTMPAAAELNRAEDDVLLDMASPPSGGTENGSRRPTTMTQVPPPPPTTTPSLSQADEDGLAAERKQKEEEQQLRDAKAKANLEAGGIAVVFSFAVITGWLCLPSEAKRPSNTRFTVSLLLAFGTFVSGNCLMLLSMSMIGLRRRLVTGAQRGASRCLSVLCAALSAMTLASLLALLPGRVYLCLVGVAVLAAVALPVAAAHWYVARRAHGGAGAGGDAEYSAEVEAAWKTTSSVTNSAFGGLVGVLSGASKIAGTATSRTTATYVAIFFMFSTAIIGMFVMTLSKKVLDVTNRRFQRFLVGAIRLLNAFLLCSLASAALAASYVVLGFRMVAAFAPLAVTFIVFLLLHHCTPRRAVRRRSGRLSEERLKATEDIASKVTAATLGAIMSVMGGSLGEEDHHRKAAGPLDAVMVILTSAFVSGFGFMLLAAMPASSSARARLAPVAKVLA
uniref:Uncharacterized protein n=1 Tax=Oryza meridionalis TaxID=40149 RepID=A0A0E0E357_9ORYZ